jgi:hypothetical protein
MTSLAYRSGTGRLAVHRARGRWVVYDIRGFDPKKHLLKDMPVLGERTNKSDALALARAAQATKGLT